MRASSQEQEKEGQRLFALRGHRAAWRLLIRSQVHSQVRACDQQPGAKVQERPGPWAPGLTPLIATAALRSASSFLLALLKLFPSSVKTWEETQFSVEPFLPHVPFHPPGFLVALLPPSKDLLYLPQPAATPPNTAPCGCPTATPCSAPHPAPAGSEPAPGGDPQGPTLSPPGPFPAMEGLSGSGVFSSVSPRAAFLLEGCTSAHPP